MTKLGTLTKGLLGASALSLFVGSNAFAAGTAAGTNVQNTFTLDYQVSGVDQPTIDTGPTGTDTPTEFTVDRLIDLTVVSTLDADVAPDADAQSLEFSVTNTGNDTQAYALTLEDIVGTDDFDTTPLVITYFVDDGDGLFNPLVDTAGPAYTAGTPTADIAADGILWVVVTGDIAATVVDGETDSVILVADTLEPSTAGGTAGDPVLPDTDGNDNDLSVVENVLADLGGDGATDGVGDGAHSATGTYTVVAADLTASKAVTVFLQDGVDTATCGAFPGSGDADPLSIPGSCVEYVITATNDAGASADATAIAISDFLPAELIFAGAQQTGFTGSPTFTPPTVGEDCTETVPAPNFESTCEVVLTGGTLAPGATGTITIRALVE